MFCVKNHIMSARLEFAARHSGRAGADAGHQYGFNEACSHRLRLRKTGESTTVRPDQVAVIHVGQEKLQKKLFFYN